MNTTTDPDARALQRIAQLDASIDTPTTGTAPMVSLSPRHVMKAVVETLSDADVLLLGVHLTRPLPGRVNTALRSSTWLREVVNCVTVDCHRETAKGGTH